MRLDLKLYRRFVMMSHDEVEGRRGEIRDGEAVRDHDDSDYADEARRVFGGLHDRFVSVLLDEIERERFPSNEMLGLLESHMTVHDRVRIAEVLLDKLAAQRYPSPDMMRRVARLVG